MACAVHDPEEPECTCCPVHGKQPVPYPMPVVVPVYVPYAPWQPTYPSWRYPTTVTITATTTTMPYLTFNYNQSSSAA